MVMWKKEHVANKAISRLPSNWNIPVEKVNITVEVLRELSQMSLADRERFFEAVKEQYCTKCAGNVKQKWCGCNYSGSRNLCH